MEREWSEEREQGRREGEERTLTAQSLHICLAMLTYREKLSWRKTQDPTMDCSSSAGCERASYGNDTGRSACRCMSIARCGNSFENAQGTLGKKLWQEVRAPARTSRQARRWCQMTRRQKLMTRGASFVVTRLWPSSAIHCVVAEVWKGVSKGALDWSQSTSASISQATIWSTGSSCMEGGERGSRAADMREAREARIEPTRMQSNGSPCKCLGPWPNQDPDEGMTHLQPQRTQPGWPPQHLRTSSIDMRC
jgi:hypothetical protein